MDVLLVLLAAYLVIRLVTKKQLRDLPIRWSFVLLAGALAPAAYLGFGWLEREGVVNEIYEGHAYNAVFGGTLGMIFIAPILLTLALLSFLKERRARR